MAFLRANRRSHATDDAYGPWTGTVGAFLASPSGLARLLRARYPMFLSSAFASSYRALGQASVGEDVRPAPQSSQERDA